MKAKLWTAKRKPSKIMAAKKKQQLEQWKNASPEEKLLCAFQLYELGMKLKEVKIDADSAD